MISLVSILVAGLGLISGVNSIVPRINVSTPVVTDPLLHAPTLFEVTNVGYLTAYDVHPMLGICAMYTIEVKPDHSCNGSLLSRLAPDQWVKNSLAMDERATIFLEDAISIQPSDRFGGADISIVVEYKLAFVPFRFEKEFRFITERATDGKIYWRSFPVNR